jgi:Domain of unknown function (DUF4412)
MKSAFLRRVVGIIALGCLTAAASFAFEGKVVMKMTSGKDSLPMTYYVKGSKIRMEFSPPADKSGNGGNPAMASVVDWDAREMLILMPEQKMYMVHTLKDVDPEKVGKKAQETQFKPTGRKEKIAGYEGEEYVGVSEGKRTEMWVTKGLGKFMMANQAKGGRGNRTSQWEEFMRQGDFFALRIVQRKNDKENGPEEFRMEATNIDKTPQHDSLFRPPADFQKFEMPNMGGILKGMIPGNR